MKKSLALLLMFFFLNLAPQGHCEIPMAPETPGSSPDIETPSCWKAIGGGPGAMVKSRTL
ncbi:MAG TPA: hypothetical protein PK997_05845 [Candidatus Omnitrophota bacterium]|nr:hypothetical protein [Candidatus Omnitrophota bacterium]HQB94717.1 hypothetical protein [Candidatus Omnitrophota bacterium]